MMTEITAPSYPALARKRTPSPLVPEIVAVPVVEPPPLDPPPETFPRKSICTNPLRPPQVTGCQTPEAEPRDVTRVPSDNTVITEAVRLAAERQRTPSPSVF